MPDTLLEQHSFVFNPDENGGESLTLVTKFFANGDPGGVYANQELTLQSYGNSASINLFGSTIDPARLRILADELEKVQQSAVGKTDSCEESAYWASINACASATLISRNDIVRSEAVIVDSLSDLTQQQIADAPLIILRDGRIVKNRFGRVSPMRPKKRMI